VQGKVNIVTMGWECLEKEKNCGKVGYERELMKGLIKVGDLKSKIHCDLEKMKR
jgi:hypothetical protein